MTKPHVTAARLRELLTYDPQTGMFSWNHPSKTSKPVGCQATSGGSHTLYLFISIDDRSYRAHRLAWLYIFGSIPANIDHADGNGLNNRIDNLRACDQTLNNANARLRCDSKSGLKGVIWESRTERWRVQIKSYGKKIHVGRFRDRSEAHAAYFAMAKKLFGRFARAA
jgi:hypothetical protein